MLQPVQVFFGVIIGLWLSLWVNMISGGTPIGAFVLAYLCIPPYIWVFLKWRDNLRKPS